MTRWQCRGVVTFLTENPGDGEYMYLFTADGFEGELKECDEGDLQWVDRAFRRYTGTYTFDGTVLDGVYSDKSTWKEAKNVTIDGDILTAVGVKTGETITYVRKLVPATVRYHYTDAVKSMALESEPWL